jgi:acyl-coenzyme A thioesterase PaaI-like protein
MTVFDHLVATLDDVDLSYASLLERDAVELRRIVDLLMRVPYDSPLLVEVADELHALADSLECPERTVSDAVRYPGWRHDPVSGAENALAPPVVLDRRQGGGTSGEVTFGLPYQGPAGFVHGGVSAMVMDHVLSVLDTLGGAPVVTAQLTVRYHRPLPLFRTVAVASRSVRNEGRKHWATGEMVVDGVVAVSAEGLFIEKRLDRVG